MKIAPSLKSRIRAYTSKFDYEQIPVGYYDAVYHRSKGVQSKWHQMKFARFHTLLKGLTHHMDIGCGPGTFVGSVGDDHLSVGVDISASQVDFARKKYGGPRKCFERIDGDLELFPNKSFDVVTMIELIEHLLPDQNESLLREALRVLRPGGHLLVSTPNYGGLWPKVEFLVNRLGHISYSYQHTTHHTHSSLRTFLQEAGLTDVSVVGYMFIAPFTACLGWRFADVVASLEPEGITSRWGLLLLGLGTKPL